MNHHTVILCLNGSWFDNIVCHSSCFEGKDRGLLAFMEMPMSTYDGGRNAKGVELGRHRWHGPHIRIRDRIMALKEDKSNTPSRRGTG